MRAPLPICCILAVVAAACGGGGDGGYPAGPPAAPSTPNPPTGSTGSNPPTTTGSVVVQNNSFRPGDVTLAVGGTVTWTWDACTGGDGYGGGATCVSHNVTFDQGASSPTQGEGEFTRQFNTAGTFAYRCTIHGAGMSGRVVVR